MEYKPTLEELLTHVDVGTDWLRLGVLLELDMKDLTAIERERPTIDERVQCMYAHWLKTNPNATRGQLIKALGKIKANTLADKYKKWILSTTARATATKRKPTPSVSKPNPKTLNVTHLQKVLNLLKDAYFNGDWEGLGLELGLYPPTLSNIQHTYGRGSALRECLATWLQRADGVDKNGGANYVSLANAVERLGQKAAADHIRRECQIDIPPLEDTPTIDIELRHYREALKTPVTCRLTKAVVQGEARVGKTAFRSLLLDEKYDKASTGIAEPRVGIYCYRRDTGKRYELLNAKKLEEIVKNALKKDALAKSTNSPINGKKTPNGNETPDEDNDGFVDGKETTDGNKASGNGNESSLSKEVEKVLEEVQQCSGEENGLEGAQWLYLIDTGGQIAFQKLLPIFMPFAQVLILVVDISKELSSQSTAVMHYEGEDLRDRKQYSLPVEEILKQIISSIASGMQHFRNSHKNHRLTVKEILKQIISSIASGMQHFRDSYKDHEVLRDLVPEKLQILTIGTHGDECSDLAESKRILEEKLAEIIKGNDDCESIEDNHLVRVHEIDGRIASAAIEEIRFNDEKTGSSLKMADAVLEKNGKDIKIPFFYYFFDIVLRAATKEECGVLQLSTCISLGEDLKLSKDEVLKSLKFLHHINSIIYYHDSKACGDLVFVNIDSLIGILKKLVGRVYHIHSEAKKYTGVEDGFIKGMLSKSEFKEICKDPLDCIKKELKVNDIATKLLNLFVELSIATPIDDKYFIPALLPVKDVTDINPYNDREPLLFYFKKATPMGLFCSVITRLLSSSCYEIASPKINSNFSNYIELKYHTEGVASFFLVLVEQVNCIEVHCGKQRGEGIVREDVKKAIVSAAAKHNLSASHRNPEIRFYCPCERSPGGSTGSGGSAGADGSAGTDVTNRKKHTVKVETVTKSCIAEERYIFHCSEKDDLRECDEKKKWNSWLDSPKIALKHTLKQGYFILGPMILLGLMIWEYMYNELTAFNSLLIIGLLLFGVFEYRFNDTVFSMTIPVGIQVGRAASLLLDKILLDWPNIYLNYLTEYFPEDAPLAMLIAVQMLCLYNFERPGFWKKLPLKILIVFVSPFIGKIMNILQELGLEALKNCLKKKLGLMD